jgi:hypothetical protein
MTKKKTKETEVPIEISQVVEEEYLPGMSVTDRFRPKEMIFLAHYAKTLDLTKSYREAGYENYKQAQAMFKRPRVQQEMLVIADMWLSNVRMTAEHASAKHIQLMQKFEKEYDSLSSTTSATERNIKGQLASTLGKMSDSYMKAVGLFTKQETETGNQVVINIDLGDGEVEVNSNGKNATLRKKQKEIIDAEYEEEDSDSDTE